MAQQAQQPQQNQLVSSVSNEDQQRLVAQKKFEIDAGTFLKQYSPIPTPTEIIGNPTKFKADLDVAFQKIVSQEYASPAIQGLMQLISAHHSSVVACAYEMSEAKDLQIAKLNSQVLKSKVKPEMITSKIWSKKRIEFEKLKFKGKNEKRRFVEELKVKSGIGLSILVL